MSRISFSSTRSYENSLRIGVGVSLILHVVLLLSLNRSIQPEFHLQPLVVDVSIETLRETSPESKKQIVTPPDTPNDTPPEDAKYLSDRDNSTPREQIKRGITERPGQPSKEPAPRQAPKEREKSPPQKNASPKISAPAPKSESHLGAPRALSSLNLDSGTLLEKFSKPSAPASNSSMPRPFSRPFGSGAAFHGAMGSPDFLPNLPDGDLTLLNTKANQFAVFVRRVASQVFAQIRSQGWDLLAYSDIRAISDYTTVRATLSPRGDLISVTMEGDSGSGRFDRVIVDAAKKGSSDPNPPKAAAASDGNFYFIFKAKSWSQSANNPRTGAPTERRWLLLATGLE